MSNEQELHNDVPGVQHVLRKLVEREVFMNIGCWVQAVTEMARSGGHTTYIDSDDTYNWWQGEPDKLQAVRDNNFDICEDEDGNFYWYAQDEPQPFGDEPPNNYVVREIKVMELEEEGLEPGDEGWYWGFVTADLEDEHQCDSRQQAVTACWADDAPEAFDFEEDAVDDCIDQNGIDLDEHRPEVYEHWVVSNWFGRKLEERGQPVFDIMGDTVWGRTCTGQAIALDSVVFDIGYSMSILPGQANEWKDE